LLDNVVGLSKKIETN